MQAEPRETETLRDSFDARWPQVEAIVKKLIHNEEISKSDWQNSSWDVYMICSWDERGCHKLLKALETEFLNTLIVDLKSRIASIEDGQVHLREYVKCWANFKLHCQRFPKAFQQLDSATKSATITISAAINGVTSQLSVPTKIPGNTKFERSTVRSHMIRLWVQHVLQNNHLRLMNSTFDLISSERNGSIVESQLIMALIDSYSYIDFNTGRLYNYYITLFENNYFEEIEIYYAARAGEQLEKCGVIEYIKWVFDKIEKEESRVKLYLGEDERYLKRVRLSCNKALVIKFVEQVLNHGEISIKSNDAPSTKLIFEFLDRLGIDTSDKLLRKLAYYIVDTGVAHLVSLSPIGNNSEKFVENLLYIHRKFYSFIDIAFCGDKRAHTILEKSSEIVVNDTQVFLADQPKLEMEASVKQKDCQKPVQIQTRCPELLATYCDLLLRKTSLSKKMTQEDLNMKLSKVLYIVKLLKDKELFMRYYKIFFARRLILNVTVSLELEELVLKYLRLVAEVPSEHTYKLIRMFKDLKFSEDIQQEFMKRWQPIQYKSEIAKVEDETRNNNNNNNTIHTLTSRISDALIVQDNNNKASFGSLDSIEFKVLNPTAWTKTNEKYPINLPQEVTSILDNFQNFYTTEYTGRKLDWCHRLSHGSVNFNSDKGQFELEVTAAQLAILTTFNKEPESQKSLKDLEELSALNAIEFKRTLWSLVANPKLKIQPIISEPEVMEIKDLENEGTLYRVNNDFMLMKNGKPQSRGRVSLIGRLQI